MPVKKKPDSRPPEKPVLRLRHEPGPDDKHIYLTIEPDEPDQKKLTWKQYEMYVFNLLRGQFPNSDIKRTYGCAGCAPTPSAKSISC